MWLFWRNFWTMDVWIFLILTLDLELSIPTISTRPPSTNINHFLHLPIKNSNFQSPYTLSSHTFFHMCWYQTQRDKLEAQKNLAEHMSHSFLNGTLHKCDTHKRTGNKLRVDFIYFYYNLRHGIWTIFFIIIAAANKDIAVHMLTGCINCDSGKRLTMIDKIIKAYFCLVNDAHFM